MGYERQNRSWEVFLIWIPREEGGREKGRVRLGRDNPAPIGLRAQRGLISEEKGCRNRRDHIIAVYSEN
jgi:hypothetical protein